MPDQHDRSDRSDPPRTLRAGGGYRRLRSFQVATIIYDATVDFCQRFLDSRSRTVDQMTQAARSGRQNIAEGSQASLASSQTELRLVNVARASLEELLLDYQDYLRQHRLRAWTRDDPAALEVRAVGQRRGSSAPDSASSYAPWLDSADPEVVANTLICLVHQACYLLDRQVAALEQDFITDGGYTERLAAARRAERERHETAPAPPTCPACGQPMRLRTARHGAHAGQQFWGCTAFPHCHATRPAEVRA